MPVEVVWSPLAILRLQQIRAYVAQDKPEAAERLAMRIIAITETLGNHPHLGRAGAATGLRELVVGGTPYVVGYQLGGNRVTITTIWHGARQR